jgi:tungstate transport system ATP-binding protein
MLPKTTRIALPDNPAPATRLRPVADPATIPAGILPLAVEQLCYTQGRDTLLHDISFTLTTGATTIILGPNGAGKSLLLRLCHGLLQPTIGQVRWIGPAANEASKRQSMVFQRPVLLRRSVAANIEYPLRLRGIPKPARDARIEQALHLTGLSPLRKRYARVLSGGEQQRLALARAWAVEPEVLFLDEPTANLDPAATHTVEDIIARFRDAGMKIVMTTHDLGQAKRLANEILFLHHGRLLERSDAGSFFTQAQHLDARAFVRGELLW